VRDLKCRKQGLVTFIYDYCQNWTGDDLSFISKKALRKHKVVALEKAKRAIIDGRFPRLLTIMSQRHHNEMQRRQEEWYLKSSFAFGQ